MYCSRFFGRSSKLMIGDVGTVLWVLMETIGIVRAHCLRERGESSTGESRVAASRVGDPCRTQASRARIAGELLLESMTSAALGRLRSAGYIWRTAAGRGGPWAPAGLPAWPHDHRRTDLSIQPGKCPYRWPVVQFDTRLQTRRRALGTGMREGGRGLSQTRERHRARNVLVVGRSPWRWFCSSAQA